MFTPLRFLETKTVQILYHIDIEAPVSENWMIGKTIESIISCCFRKNWSIREYIPLKD